MFDGFIACNDCSDGPGGVRAVATARIPRPAGRTVSLDESAARCAQLRRRSGVGWEAARRHTAAATGHVLVQRFLQIPRSVEGPAVLALQLPEADCRYA